MATGRAEQTIRLKLPELPINTPSIFYNGALVYDIQKQEEVFSCFLPEGLEPIFQGILDRYPGCGVEVSAVGRVCVLRYNNIIDFQLWREGISSVKANWSEIPENWYKILVCDTHEELKKIKAELDALNRTDIEVMFSESEVVDVVVKGASKGKALLHQKASNKDKWRMVFAAGDNDNDLAMIEAADIGIAVANARPSVKKAASHEVADHNTPCVPQILKIMDTYL